MYGTFTLFGPTSQKDSTRLLRSRLQSEPLSARTQVWALPRSLAATCRIDVSFSSSGYLDVSVHRVPLHTLWIHVWIHEVCSCGFPHSDISGSLRICRSPKLFAAYHVFLRLSVPRHPPCALLRLTKRLISLSGCTLSRLAYRFRVLSYRCFRICPFHIGFPDMFSFVLVFDV